MDFASVPTRRLRIDKRYRHSAIDPSQDDLGQERHVELLRQEKAPPANDVQEPLLIREKRGRAVMTKAHRLYHRQPVVGTGRTLTVGVEVVATVDSQGNVVAQETVTASLPLVPSVPAVSSVALPSVPAVPAFPSTLTVPAYPFPGTSVQSAGTSTQATTTLETPASSILSLTTGAVTSLTASLAASLGYNSTSSSTILSSSFLPTTTDSTSLSSSSPSPSSSLESTSTSSWESAVSSTSSSTIESSSAVSSTEAASSASNGAYIAPGGPVNTAPAPAATTTAAATASSSHDNGVLGTPQVVGSVVGSLAGAALLLALILFLLKRHKQKQRGGALQLTDAADSQPIASSGQQMAVRSSLVPSFLNRFSGASRSTAETSTPERGFQRISGRKLPSAFSEGMTSDQFARGEGTLSGSSFYKDDTGFYGGPGSPNSATNKEFGKEIGESSATGAMGTKERVMPSPARTPIIHHPDDAPQWGSSRNGGNSSFSPPHSPNPDWPPRGTLGRSHPSHDGSRSSRFTENV